MELEFKDARWQECRNFLKKVETGEIHAFTSDFVVYSSILEINSKKGKKPESKIETFLNVIASLKGLSILRPSTKDMRDAAETMINRKLDFDDSYIVSSMKANGISTLVSFDAHFDKSDEVKRVEPIELLK